VKKKSKKQPGPVSLIELRLYVAGQTPRSLAAISNLKRICAEHFEQQCRLEVIDLAKNPALARNHQSLPSPVRKIIGDLSDTERVAVGLDIAPSKVKRRFAKA
jgi:circadian clock protein KaiB